MTFKHTDAAIARIDKYLIERFSRLKSLLAIDEINIAGSINELYREIRQYIAQVLLALANQVYADTRREENTERLDEDWLNEIMDGYDPVSKYVYNHEIDRRRARLIEAVIASDTKAKEVEAALRGMSFMSRLYADRITDEAVIQAYNDDGETYVRWVAEKDSKTCSICRNRDGRIYEIDHVPHDPHPNCRCWRERVPE